MVLTLDEQRVGIARAKPARQFWRVYDPILVAVLAVAVSVAGSALPSTWFDEAATVSAATRPIPELWAMLRNIDAVHGLYYLVMHGWLTLVPATEFLIRLPSALAVGLAAAGVVVLGRQLSSRSVSLCAGTIFAVLPRVTWAGIEARSYALSITVAVWLTVLCVVAARRGKTSLWIGYSVALVAATLLNVYLLLIVAAHAVLVVTAPRWRWALGLWGIATAIATAAITPFLLFATTQTAQVGWIAPLGTHTFTEVFREQYFEQSAPFMVLAAVVMLGAALLRRPTANLPGHSLRRIVVLAAVWMVMPTLVLLAYSQWGKPMYYPRYLSFTSPAMALLLGACVVALARHRVQMVIVVALFAVAAVPNYLSIQRSPYAKGGMDFSPIADVIGQHAKAGDCLILDNTTAWKPGPISPVTAARPGAYAKLFDPGRGRRAVDRNMLWDSRIAIWLWANRLHRCHAIWTVSEYDSTLPDHAKGVRLSPGPRLAMAPAYQYPRRYGFHVVERWQFNFAQVTKSQR